MSSIMVAVGRRVLNSPDAFPDGRDRRHQRAGGRATRQAADRDLGISSGKKGG